MTSRTASPSSSPSPTAASSSRAARAGAARASGPTTSSATAPTSPSPSSRPRPTYKTPGDGLQQAKDYAEILGLKFAYATNGHGIIEFDYLTGLEREIDAFPSPDELWARLRGAEQLADDSRRAAADARLSPQRQDARATTRRSPSTGPSQAILQGKRRVLLTMATGTGKTVVAFQICWKLWTCPLEPHRRAPPPARFSTSPTATSWSTTPRTRSSPPSATPAARSRTASRAKSREMYFAIYQAIAKDERRPGLYQEYPPRLLRPDHRGRVPPRQRQRREQLAGDPGVLRAGLPARHDGHAAARGQPSTPTATSATRSTPTACARASTTASWPRTACIGSSPQWDAAGWRPSQGDSTATAARSPTRSTRPHDFERVVALRARTEAVARHLTDFLKKTDRFAKTIVFCVDQEHADEMRRALNNLNADLVQQHPDYVCRVTCRRGRHRPRPPEPLPGRGDAPRP